MRDRFVATESRRRPAGTIQGQILRFSEHHLVAIYLRDGSLWIADFVDGQGVLIDAATWFRFNCGTLATAHARRRMAAESAIPLSLELVERIEALHHAAATSGLPTAGIRQPAAGGCHRNEWGTRLRALLKRR